MIIFIEKKNNLWGNRAMNHPTTKLCGEISGPTAQDAIEQVKSIRSDVDCIEIRADLLEDHSVENVKQLMELASLPTILTLRRSGQGGAFSGSEEKRLQTIESLLTLEPTWVDLEHDVSDQFFSLVANQYPKTSILCSYHNFQETPEDLSAILDQMERKEASLYKIATQANNTLDSMRMLLFVKQSTVPIIGLCMDSEGSISRIVGAAVGNAITYAACDESHIVAPGQLTVYELNTRYRIRQLTKNTNLLGLIGDPVDKSPSIHTHHLMIEQLGVDAIYVRVRVTPEELPKFLSLSKEIGFLGWSVTMPLKEEVAHLIHSNEPINSLKLSENEWEGINTDGWGALNAIEAHESVQDKQIVILGAGGTAQAIAKEAIKRKAKVILLNRTKKRAEQAAKKLGCSWGGLDEFPSVAKQGYDILVNTTPLGMKGESHFPVPTDEMLPNKLCLEVISNPTDTPFSLAAKSCHCTVIPGIEMFKEQAKKKFSWWFKKEKVQQ